MRNISSYFGRLVKTVSIGLMLLFSISSLQAQDVKEGESLFKARCTACHQVNRAGVGPALEGMTERHPDEDWLVSWIKNSQALIASGDEAAVQLFEDYNRIMMPANLDLSDEQILGIIAYVEAEEVRLAEAAQAPAGGEGGAAGASGDVSALMLVTVALIAILAVVVIVVLNRVVRTLEKVVEQNKEAILKAEGEPVDKDNRLLLFAQAFVKNKKLVFFVLLMVVSLLGVWGWKTMWNVGVHDGYMPVQPIKFSHQIHAGVNQIECQYCHGGAFKSKNASIPSANVCMNCHTTVTAADHYNGEISPEIQKIYRAMDYDPDTREYGDNPRAIEWVRIHNLPDFAYFNHSQHVTVAGVECQTCHGPIESMEEVYQYSPLTMKWCVDCHRETSVDMDNEYYDQLIEAHEKLKKGEKMTAAMIGGLECGKCHY